MQAQFGKELLGVMPLKKQGNAKRSQIKSLPNQKNDKDKRTKLKHKAADEKTHYSNSKKFRRTLLRNSKGLSDISSEYLDEYCKNMKILRYVML